MRDIRFRAWHPEEKKMWDDVGIDGYGGIILGTEYMGLQPLKGKAILMQFTGLHDKNGMEIYEGDWVRYTAKIIEGNEYREEEIKGVVEFRFGSFVATSPDSNYDTELQGSELWMEVIGNIWEPAPAAPG